MVRNRMFFLPTPAHAAGFVHQPGASFVALPYQAAPTESRAAAPPHANWRKRMTVIGLNLPLPLVINWYSESVQARSNIIGISSADFLYVLIIASFNQIL